MIRVGTLNYPNFKPPSHPEYSNVIVMTKNFRNTPGGEYHVLGPYDLTDKLGRIHENLWQMSKVYKKVPQVKPFKSHKWSHPTETHLTEEDELTDEHLLWRQKGYYFHDYIRYPVGTSRKIKGTCLYSLKESEPILATDTPQEMRTKLDPRQLDYVEGRKEIYAPLYLDMVRKHSMFQVLKDRLDRGENLLILEVDGPKIASLDYYQDKYGVGDDFIEHIGGGASMKATRKNLEIMLKDTRHPFGHGYCLAMALLEYDDLLR